nr:class Ib ribonucleoside-diphosphate reductase assembly flavoprotein NrdI [Tissierella sp.]
MKRIIIAYDSRTGNVDRFIKKMKNKLKDRATAGFQWEFYKIEEGMVLEEDFHFITFTTNFGEVPLKTKIFVEKNYEKMQSVSSSGNMNWGTMYGRAANRIRKDYDIPILMKFELSGTSQDVEKIIGGLEEYYGD